MQVASRKSISRYPVHRSPLYGLNSKRKLAELLGMQLGDLKELVAQGDENYKVWPMGPKRSDLLAGLPAKKKRIIQQPKIVLSVVQRRIGDLLGRIEVPDYLHSAIKGRSYLSNACVHVGHVPGFKVDIKDFYPSVRRSQIKSFFQNRLHCAHDVSSVIADLCSYKGLLPTGTPVSPLLSFWACEDMFDRVKKVADGLALNFTLYVDDMFFSGESASEMSASKIVKILARHGFTGHKVVCFPVDAAKIITGVAVIGGQTSVPYSRQRRIRQFERAFYSEIDPLKSQLLAQTLIGQFREAERLQPGSKLRAIEVERHLAKIVARSGVSGSSGRKKRRSRLRPKVMTSSLRRAIALMRANRKGAGA